VEGEGAVRARGREGNCDAIREVCMYSLSHSEGNEHRKERDDNPSDDHDGGLWRGGREKEEEEEGKGEMEEEEVSLSLRTNERLSFFLCLPLQLSDRTRTRSIYQ